MDLKDLLQGAITQGVADKISDATGIDKAAVEKVVSAGAPMILGRMASNTSSSEGAKALDTAVSDHSGSLLENLGSLFGGTSSSEDGTKILGHVFGDSEEKVVSKISNNSGVSTTQVLQILSFVAPIIMAVLAKKKSSDGLDADGLSSVLSGQKSGDGSLLSSLATKMLDKDGDGSIVDDVFGMFTKK